LTKNLNAILLELGKGPTELWPMWDQL
jgi:hypothetical protein